jgi:ribonuclease-3
VDNGGAGVTATPFEARLGVSFRDPSLLSVALTHRSVLNEDSGVVREDNERLEFLGDAIVGAIVAEELYRAFPQATEGSLTNMRAELVRASSLARWARRFELGDHLQLGRGEEARGGRDRDGLLASGFEAVVGALYLDQGLEAIRSLIRPLIAEALPTLTPSSPRARDPKSELQYRCQARWGVLPVYRVLAVEGPEHRPVFSVEVSAGEELTGRGVGPSKQAAEQEAARQVLASWPEPAPDFPPAEGLAAGSEAIERAGSSVQRCS